MAAKKTVGELVYKVIGDAKGLGVTLAKSEASVKSFDKSVGKFSKSSIASFVGIGIGVTALGGTLVSATKKAAAFESTMGNISTLIDGNTESVDKMKRGILDMTRTIPRSGEELGTAAYDVLSAGITDTSDALSVLEASAKLAVAGLGDTKEAVNLTTSAINAFKIPAKDADRVAGVLFETVRAGKTTVAELASSFGNVAAAAQGAGVSLEETQAATAALTTVGFRTATAQDRLRALFDEMTRSSGKLSDGYDELTGKTISSSVQSDGFKNVLDELFAQTGNNTIAFKNMFSSVEAGGAAMALVSGASDTYNDTLVAMTKNSDALEAAFADQADTTANQLAKAQNEMNILLIALGEEILPVVNKALSTFVDIINTEGKKAFRTYISDMERTTGVSALLGDEMKKVNDGTSDFSAQQVEAAIKANLLQQEYARLAKVVNLLKVVQEEGFFERKQAIKALEDEGIKLSDYATTMEKIFKPGNVQDQANRAISEYSTLLDENSKSQEEFNKDLEAVLDPQKEMYEKMNNEVTPAIEDNSAAIEKAASELENFQSQMVGFIETSKDAVDSLNNELADGFKKFGEDIAGNFNDTNQKLSSIVIGAEQEIISLKKALRDADDRDEKKRIKKQIQEQEDILSASEGFEERRQERLAAIREKLTGAGVGESEIDNLLKVQSLEEEVQEQRRVAALDEFTRFEEEQVNKLIAIVDAFIAEKGVLEQKVELQKNLEADLTEFLLSQNSFRTESVDDFAKNAIEKYKDVADELRSAVSLQRQLNSLRANPEQFQKGGHVGAGGGEVHANEYVIPAHLVGKYGGAISAIEEERKGGANNSSVVNAPITINAPNSGDADFAGIGREWAWELGRL